MKEYPFTGRSIVEGRKMLTDIFVDKIDGVMIQNRNTINLIRDLKTIATITILDPDMWEEICKNIGVET